MRIILAAVLVLCSNSWADQPYKIVIIANSELSKQAAEKFRDYINGNVPPFNQIEPSEIKVEIVSAPPETLKCHENCNNVQRLVCCDSDVAAKIGDEHGGHLTCVVTNVGSSGAGGSVPTVSASTLMASPGLLLHEIGHSVGSLSDEYEYENGGEEARLFCKPPKPSLNVACFVPSPPYISDAAAKSKHRKDIPWSDMIANDTLITNGSDLGTPVPKYDRDIAALYRGGNCNEVLPCWKPYLGGTFMDQNVYTSTPKIPKWHAYTIRRGMEVSRGAYFTDRVQPELEPTKINPEATQDKPHN